MKALRIGLLLAVTAACTDQVFVTDVAFRVIAVSPSPGGVDVDRAAPIVVTFSEELDGASFANQGAIRVEHVVDADTTRPIDGSFEFGHASGEPYRVTFRPKLSGRSAGLPYSATVRVSLSTSIRRRRDGAPLAAPVSFEFRTQQPPALSLVHVTPHDNVEGFARTGDVALRFSEPVDCRAFIPPEGGSGGIVSFEEVLDPHPKWGAREGVRAEVKGTWSCPRMSEDDSNRLSGQCSSAFDNDLTDYCTVRFRFAALDVTDPVQRARQSLGMSSRIELVLPGADDASLRLHKVVRSMRATEERLADSQYRLSGALPASLTIAGRVVDPPALSLNSTSPTGGDGPITAVFSERVDCESLDGGATITETYDLFVQQALGAQDATRTVTGTWTCATTTDREAYACDAASCRYVFTPDAAFHPSSTVRVRLGAGIESVRATSRGGRLLAEHEFSFRTSDPPPFFLVSLSPGTGTTYVPRRPTIVATLSAPIDCNSVQLGTSFSVEERTAPGALGTPPEGTFTPVDGALTCDSAARTLSFTPSSDFAPASTVRVRVGSDSAATTIRAVGATAHGGTLPTPATTHAFQITPPSPLRIVSTTPAAGSELGAFSGALSVRVTFDRDIECSTGLARLTLARIETDSTLQPVASTTACEGTRTLVLSPSSVLTAGRSHRVTVEAGVLASDARLAGGEIHGELPDPHQFTFTVRREPLHVMQLALDTSVRGVALDSLIGLRFDQPLEASSLVPCTPAQSTNCNVSLHRGPTTDGALVELRTAGYDDSTLTVSFDPARSAEDELLEPGQTYTLLVLGGDAGPRAAGSQSTLAESYSAMFTTEARLRVRSTSPASGATGHDVTAPICIEFSEIVDASMLLRNGEPQITVRAEGESQDVSLDASQPYAIDGHRVCLRAPTLAYGTQFTVTISADVGATGATLGTPYSWTFRTREELRLESVRIRNSVINEPLVDGASDVPVIVAFHLRFTAPVEPSAVGAVNLSGDGAENVTVVRDPTDERLIVLGGPTELAFSPPGGPPAVYTLRISGGSGGLRSTEGALLEDDLAFSFTTSEEARLAITPPEGTVDPSVRIALVSLNRDLFLPSLTNSTLVLRQAGTPVPTGLVRLLEQRRTVTLEPPSPLSVGATYELQVQDGVLDSRGNPVRAQAGWTVEKIDPMPRPTTATCDALSCAVSPAPGATSETTFVLTLPAPGADGSVERRLPRTFYSNPPERPAGSVSFEARGGAGCPSAGTQQPIRVEFVPGAARPIATPDTVRVKLTSPQTLVAGCEYALKIRQDEIENVYGRTAATDPCGNATPETSDVISDRAECDTDGESQGLVYTWQ